MRICHCCNMVKYQQAWDMSESTVISAFETSHVYRWSNLIRIFVLIILLSACTATLTPMPFFGEGYRFEGDQCKRIGENSATNQYLDHTADLVGCPENMEAISAFVVDTGAIEVARIQGYVVYSIPLQ